MGDFLQSGRRKLARAKAHITDLANKQAEFFARDSYTIVSEPDPDEPQFIVHKLKLVREFDPIFEDITADATFNLRASLDHACYETAVEKGRPFGRTEPEFASFPIMKTEGADALNKTLMGKCKDLPWQIMDLIRKLQPYPGGNNILVALNDLCNTHKHAFVVPNCTAAARLGVRAESHTVDSAFRMPREHVWDRSKNEMVLYSAMGSGTQFQFDFAPFVAFAKMNLIDGRPVLEVLSDFTHEVESILIAIEAEAVRVGIFK